VVSSKYAHDIVPQEDEADRFFSGSDGAYIGIELRYG
jgi:hypothetical protein